MQLRQKLSDFRVKLRQVYENELGRDRDDKGPPFVLEGHPILNRLALCQASEVSVLVPESRYASPESRLEALIKVFAEDAERLTQQHAGNEAPQSGGKEAAKSQDMLLATAASKPEAAAGQPIKPTQPPSPPVNESQTTINGTSAPLAAAAARTNRQRSPLSQELDPQDIGDEVASAAPPSQQPQPQLGRPLAATSSKSGWTDSNLDILNYISTYSRSVERGDRLAIKSLTLGRPEYQSDYLFDITNGSANGSRMSLGRPAGAATTTTAPQYEKPPAFGPLVTMSKSSSTSSVVISIGDSYQSLATASSAKDTAKQLQRSPSEEEVSAQLQLQNMLAAAIKYQQDGELRNAFKLYAITAHQGYSIGLFLCGMALRHGWGCAVNRDLAVACFETGVQVSMRELNRVLDAYSAMAGLPAQTSTKPADAILTAHKLVRSVSANSQVEDNLDQRYRQAIDILKGELAMGLYELGQCYRFGWGVRKSVSAAGVYFRLAADLGDVDAQLDVSIMYAHGQGVPKSQHLAAAYTRMAALNGRDEFGNSWAYKAKYDVFFRDHYPEIAAKEDLMHGGRDGAEHYRQAKYEADERARDSRRLQRYARSVSRRLAVLGTCMPRKSASPSMPLSEIKASA